MEMNANEIGQAAQSVSIDTQQKDHADPAIRLVPVSFLQGKQFIVEEYQRGYKWGKREILQLIQDIDGHDPATGIYCLQPLIVCVHENGSLEVVDGQQRCTSIYLLLFFLLKGQRFFSVDYKTRPASRTFLLAELELLDQVSLSRLGNVSADLSDASAIDQLWLEFLESQPDGKLNNVDVYHFFTVYTVIRKWFESKELQEIETFRVKLLSVVNFIWYQVDRADENEVPNIFLNINKGKITLTSSELIKALFILDIKRGPEIHELKAHLIASLSMEWDLIENQLHDNPFWYFICSNSEEYNKGTRIDLLFDMVKKRPLKDKNQLYSYLIYEKDFNAQADLNWREVKQLFQRLVDWYNDKDLYHFVGYLITSKMKSLNAIIELSDCRKDEFLERLRRLIWTEFQRKTGDENQIYKYQLSNVSFDEDKVVVNRILLLFNVMYYVKNPGAHKFPFEMYVENSWTIEHINPQHPKEITEVAEYIDLAMEFFGDASGEFVTEVLNYLQVFNGKKMTELSRKEQDIIKDYFDKIATDFEVHLLGNLTLLDRNTNSAVGNNRFGRKREKILAFDSDGSYSDEENPEIIHSVFIPVTTKNVFSKTYSTDISALGNLFWTRADQQAYLEEIQHQLNDFLPSLNESDET